MVGGVGGRGRRDQERPQEGLALPRDRLRSKGPDSIWPRNRSACARLRGRIVQSHGQGRHRPRSAAHLQAPARGLQPRVAGRLQAERNNLLAAGRSRADGRAGGKSIHRRAGRHLCPAHLQSASHRSLPPLVTAGRQHLLAVGHRASGDRGAKRRRQARC